MRKGGYGGGKSDKRERKLGKAPAPRGRGAGRDDRELPHLG